ncbi:MAG: hypothetical protein HY240_11350 [Actinobacteria bacterium]|nr:hypothetical protein [Actinomycetota bacterium]
MGLILSAALVVTSSIPPGTGVLGADVTVASAPAGELTLHPLGPFLRAVELTPQSDPVTGSVHVYNQTGSTLKIQLRGSASTTELDSLLRIRVQDAQGDLFDGTAGEFRAWTDRGVTLTPGTGEDLNVRAWLAQGSGWAGRVVQVLVEFRSTVVGGTG